jgi:hypothetical protein
MHEVHGMISAYESPVRTIPFSKSQIKWVSVIGFRMDRRSSLLEIPLHTESALRSLVLSGGDCTFAALNAARDWHDVTLA